METSQFNPDTFLNATMNAPLEKRSPIPEGDYTGVFGRPEVRVVDGKKDPTKVYTFVDIPVTVEIPADIQSNLGLQPTLRLSYSFGLDMNSTGGLDTTRGRNNGLRVLREALDLNKAGDNFSLAAVEGRPILVKVKHELYQDTIQERVKGIAKL